MEGTRGNGPGAEPRSTRMHSLKVRGRGALMTHNAYRGLTCASSPHSQRFSQGFQNYIIQNASRAPAYVAACQRLTVSPQMVRG